MSEKVVKQKELCGICFNNREKYKCPGCGLRTCSLPCVKKHKVQFDCSGKVDVTKYIPMDNIKENSNIVVQRDYNFLSKMGRQLDLGKIDAYSSSKPMFQKRRSRFNGGINKNYRRPLPQNSNMIIRKGDVKIIQLPLGMARAQKNKTHFDKKQSQYFWTMELILISKDDSVVDKIENKVSENLTAFEFLKKVELIKDDISNYFFYLKLYKENQPNIDLHTLIKIDPNSKIKDILKDKTVLEFPRIYVSYKDLSEGFDGQVVKEYWDSESDFSTDSSSSDFKSEKENAVKRIMKLDDNIDKEVSDNNNNINNDNKNNIDDNSSDTSNNNSNNSDLNNNNKLAVQQVDHSQKVTIKNNLHLQPSTNSLIGITYDSEDDDDDDDSDNEVPNESSAKFNENF